MANDPFRTTPRRPPARAILAALALALALLLAPPGASASGGGTAAGSPGSTGALPGAGMTPIPPSLHRVPAGPPSPFDGSGMWIWELPRSDGGSVARIVARARANQVGAVYVKSADGSSVWRQFSPGVVRALHRAGLRVCGWQYVYGAHPLAEAIAGASAKRAGADCFIIDAESQYEGRYAQAQTYVTNLRRRLGARFPLALAPFPYVDYHPGFPYSVFLAPGAAGFDLPQMYWRDIGVRVDTIFAHTYRYAALYNVPVYPLGQTYQRPRSSEILRFRTLARAYGATGLSWWDWQESSNATWKALGSPFEYPAGLAPGWTYPTYGLRSKGDVVVMAQERLRTAGQRPPVDGVYGTRTYLAVKAFQVAQGLPVTGRLDDLTWTRLLSFRPARVRWTTRHRAITSSGRRVLTTPVPRSARLPARRDELSGKRR